MVREPQPSGLCGCQLAPRTKLTASQRQQIPPCLVSFKNLLAFMGSCLHISKKWPCALQFTKYCFAIASFVTTCLLLLCCPGLSHCGRPRSGYSTHLAPGSGGLGAPATPCCISPAETHGTGSAEAGAAAGITQVWAPVTLLVGADQCDGEDAERCSSHCAVHSTGASCICPCPTGSPAGHHQLKELPAGLTNVPTGVAV